MFTKNLKYQNRAKIDKINVLNQFIETLEDISKLCGNQQTEKGIEPLITVEDLKLLNNFEAVILIPRINPIKSKLLPDYQIDWKFSDEKVALKEIENKEVKTFNIK